MWVYGTGKYYKKTPIILYDYQKPRIAAIYHLDNELAALEPEERRQKRKFMIEPLVEVYFAWLKKVKQENTLTPGKNLEGVNYSLNHEKALCMFLKDGEVPLDNNATE